MGASQRGAGPDTGTVVAPRLFVLVRHRDPSGVSGPGVVAVGDVLAGGVSDIQAVHGHDGATEVRYLDDPIPGPARAATPGPGRR